MFARNLSFAQFIKGIGSVGSTALVGSSPSASMGWRSVFPVFLGLTLVSLVALALLKVKESRAERAAERRQQRRPARRVGVQPGRARHLPLRRRRGRHDRPGSGPRLEALGYEESRSKFLGPTLFFGALTVGRLLGSVALSFISARAFFRVSAGLGALGILGVLSGQPALAVAGVAVAGLGFANIWPVLFSITIEARPERGAELSGLMCMAIFGGAVLPPLMGRLNDTAGSWTAAFLVPLAAFAYLLVLSLQGGGGRGEGGVRWAYEEGPARRPDARRGRDQLRLLRRAGRAGGGGARHACRRTATTSRPACGRPSRASRG